MKKIRKHINNTFKDQEVEKENNTQKMEGCRKICDIHKVWHGHLNKKDWSTYEQQNY